MAKIIISVQGGKLQALAESLHEGCENLASDHIADPVASGTIWHYLDEIFIDFTSQRAIVMFRGILNLTKNYQGIIRGDGGFGWEQELPQHLHQGKDETFNVWRDRLYLAFGYCC